MSEPNSKLEDRIHRALARLGFAKVVVKHLGDGKVEIAGISNTHPDRSIVVAIIRTCAGVTKTTIRE